MPKLVLTEELRSALKKPLGTLFPGESTVIYDEIRRLISLRSPSRVVFVGDAVSRRAVAARLRADVLIIDNREMRAQAAPFNFQAKRMFHVRNEPGTVGLGTWRAVQDAIESGNAVMIVDGEEDLLTLVAMAEAPIGSFVIYGQPGKGLVLVEVDDEARRKGRLFLEGMIRTD